MVLNVARDESLMSRFSWCYTTGAASWSPSWCGLIFNEAKKGAITHCSSNPAFSCLCSEWKHRLEKLVGRNKAQRDLNEHKIRHYGSTTKRWDCQRDLGHDPRSWRSQDMPSSPLVGGLTPWSRVRKNCKPPLCSAPRPHTVGHWQRGHGAHLLKECDTTRDASTTRRPQKCSQVHPRILWDVSGWQYGISAFACG